MGDCNLISYVTYLSKKGAGRSIIHHHLPFNTQARMEELEQYIATRCAKDAEAIILSIIPLEEKDE